MSVGVKGACGAYVGVRRGSAGNFDDRVQQRRLDTLELGIKLFESKRWKLMWRMEENMRLDVLDTEFEAPGFNHMTLDFHS